MKPGSKVMNLKDLAAYLQISPSTVYRLLNARQLPAFKIGTEWRFNIETIDKWRLDREAGSAKE